MSTKVKMPTVQIPTLRSSTTIVGTGLHAWTGAHDAQHSVLIDELVQGVQQCQSVAKKAADIMRRQKIDEDAPRRARSPQAISERKPWGASSTSSASPRGRPTTATSNTAPTTAKTLRPSSASGRASSPLGAVSDHKLATASRPALRSPSASAAPVPLRSPSASAAPVQKVKSEVTHISPSNRRTSNTATVGSPVPLAPEKLEALHQAVRRAEDAAAASSERADRAEARCIALEEKLQSISKDFEAFQVNTRQQFLHASAQQQHLWELLRRMESYMLSSGDSHNASADDRHDVARTHQHGPVESPQQMFGAHDDAEAGAWSAAVARRLDMSSESNRSHGSRVPPKPPVDLRQA